MDYGRGEMECYNLVGFMECDQDQSDYHNRIIGSLGGRITRSSHQQQEVNHQKLNQGQLLRQNGDMIVIKNTCHFVQSRKGFKGWEANTMGIGWIYS